MERKGDQTLTRGPGHKPQGKNHDLKVSWDNLELNIVSLAVQRCWPSPLTSDLCVKGWSKAASNNYFHHQSKNFSQRLWKMPLAVSLVLKVVVLSGLKPKHVQFILRQNRQKQWILTFGKLETGNIWLENFKIISSLKYVLICFLSINWSNSHFSTKGYIINNFSVWDFFFS